MTRDGVTWDGIPEPPIDTFPDRLPGGWLGYTDSGMVALPDGGMWSPFNVKGVIKENTCCGGIGGSLVVGDTLVSFSSLDSGQRNV